MNLLVTNTRNAQAYAIIRALRPHAQKVVATMEGKNRFAARLSHAANSRLVDKRYYTPSPAADWRAGRIQRENTQNEEAYIQSVLRICEAEKIDTIFPSFDPHVYVFSKNKERFEKLGVLIPVPDYEVVITPLDKWRTLQSAQEVGFPCPRTYLPKNEGDLKEIADELEFPLVMKFRFTSGGRGIEMVKDLAELSVKASLLKEDLGMPLLQEYIPGWQKQHHYLVLDKKGQLTLAFCTKRWRNLLRVTSNYPTFEESMVYPYHLRAAELLQKLEWWGGATVETKVDARDGFPKLMEINPRLGYRLWLITEIGINAPLMCLKISRGEEVDARTYYPAGTMLFDPIEDLLALGFKLLDRLAYGARVGFRREAPVDPLHPPMTLKELAQSYRRPYLCEGDKIFSPYFRYFFQDPLVSILWWLQFFESVLREARQLGR